MIKESREAVYIYPSFWNKNHFCNCSKVILIFTILTVRFKIILAIFLLCDRSLGTFYFQNLKLCTHLTKFHLPPSA